jgi:serine/threonine protein kinase
MIVSEIGKYRVLEKIGAGGMGEVYKAFDTVLDRPVALKILPADLVKDEDRVRRFVQEAKAASALNHPQIVTVYDIGQVEQSGAGIIHYIAMEFIDGETLSGKIHREKAEMKKLIEFLAQVADGLSKAHAAGIIHRDLKPDNIMIARDGYAKILDFGLAKLTEPTKPTGASSEEAATAIMQQTQAGMVMGTVGYMSPEQVQGKSVDLRSDIFSFGCVLYEVTTGRKPFEGETIVDSLYKVAHAQTQPISDFNPNAPIELQRIIRKCLAKDPEERYQSIKDVAIDLRELNRQYDSAPTLSGFHATVPSGPVSQPVTAPVKMPSSRLWLYASLGVLAIAVIAFAVYKTRFQPQPSSKPAPTFETMNLSRLTSTGKAGEPAISSDGRYVAYVQDEAGKQGLWLQQVATSSNVPIVPAAEVDYVGVTFSPDGNYLYYVVLERGKAIAFLYQVPVVGGAPRKLIEDVDSAVTFSPDGQRFAFLRQSRTEGNGLIVADAKSLQEQKLAVHKPPANFQLPAWSPDGKSIAYATPNLTGGIHIEIGQVQVADGSERTINSSRRWLGMSGLAWLSDVSGLIVSARDQTPGSTQLQIWRISLPSGEARRITNDLNTYANVSLTGDSAHITTVVTQRISNLWVAPQTDLSRGQQIPSGSGRINQIARAPDGRFVYVSDASGTADLWMMDADGKNQKQLTVNAGLNIFPNVSSDGRTIVFSSDRANTTGKFNIWRMDLDGGGLKQLTSGDGEYWPDVSPDGKWVVYTQVAGNKATAWKVPMEGGSPVQLTDTLALQPTFSPDGKFVACRYLENQLNALPKLAILSSDDGKLIRAFDVLLMDQNQQFRWMPNGKGIAFLDSRSGTMNLWVQPVDGSPPKQLTNLDSDSIFAFNWSRDGKQLAVIRGVVSSDVIKISNVSQTKEQ